MKNITFLLPIAFSILFVLACKNSEPAVAENASGSTEASTETTTPANDPVTAADPDQQSDSVIVHLRRTACFGKCPVFTFTILGNGKAAYEGRAHVDRIGQFEAQADQEMIDEIMAEAERLGFFEMQAEYDRPVTDLPSTIIGIRRSATMKEVKGRVEQPESFKKLAKFIEDRIATFDWKPVAPQD